MISLKALASGARFFKTAAKEINPETMKKIMDGLKDLPADIKNAFEAILQKTKAMHPEDRVHEIRVFLSDHGKGFMHAPASLPMHFSEIEPYYLYEKNGLKFRFSNELLSKLRNNEKSAIDWKLPNALSNELRNFMQSGINGISVKGNAAEIVTFHGKLTGHLEDGVFTFGNLVELKAGAK